MNTVEVNEEQIREELQSLEGDFIPKGEPAPGGASGSEEPQPQAPPQMDWTMPAGLLVFVFDKVIAPNWELEPLEKQLLHESLIGTLQAFFPTVQLDPRYVALLSLGGVFVTIAGKRVDLETRTMKPMRVKPAPAPQDADADSARAET